MNTSSSRFAIARRAVIVPGKPLTVAAIHTANKTRENASPVRVSQDTFRDPADGLTAAEREAAWARRYGVPGFAGI